MPAAEPTMIKQSMLPSAAQCPYSLELDLLLATLIQRPGSRRSGEESFGAIFKDDHMTTVCSTSHA